MARTYIGDWIPPIPKELVMEERNTLRMMRNIMRDLEPHIDAKDKVLIEALIARNLRSHLPTAAEMCEAEHIENGPDEPPIDEAAHQEMIRQATQKIRDDWNRRFPNSDRFTDTPAPYTIQTCEKPPRRAGKQSRRDG